MIIERTGTMWPPPPGSKLGSFSLWSRILNFKSVKSLLESQTQTKSTVISDVLVKPILTPQKVHFKANICLFLTCILIHFLVQTLQFLETLILHVFCP